MIYLTRSTQKYACLHQLLTSVITGIVWSALNVASVFREWQATPVKSTIVDYNFDVKAIPFPTAVLSADQVTMGRCLEHLPYCVTYGCLDLEPTTFQPCEQPLEQLQVPLGRARLEEQELHPDDCAKASLQAILGPRGTAGRRRGP